MVDQKNHAESFSFELLVADCLSSDRESVAKELLWVLGAFNCLLDGVESASGHSDADYVFEVALAVALLKLLVDDVLHAAINLHSHIVEVLLGDTLADVEVDALVDESFCVEVVFGDVKSVTSLQGQSQRIIMLLQIVEDLGGD